MQRNELENTLDKLFGLCYEEDGKFHQEIEENMSWLYKTVVKWCNDCRQQVVKTMSKSMDVFYKRSSRFQPSASLPSCASALQSGREEEREGNPETG